MEWCSGVLDWAVLGERIYCGITKGHSVSVTRRELQYDALGSAIPDGIAQ